MIKKLGQKIKNYYSKPITLKDNWQDRLLCTLVAISMIASMPIAKTSFKKSTATHESDDLNTLSITSLPDVDEESLDKNNDFSNEDEEVEIKDDFNSIILDDNYKLEINMEYNPEIVEIEEIKPSNPEIEDNQNGESKETIPEVTEPVSSQNEPSLVSNPVPYISDTLSLIEMETVARYIFDLTDETKWKECVCTIFAEGGCNNEEETYHVTTAALNETISYRYSKVTSLYKRLTGGGFTAYKNPNYNNFFAMDLDSLRALPGYIGIVKCLYSQKLSHNFAQFRSRKSKVGVPFTEKGNRYLDPITDYMPIEEREYYPRFLTVISDVNNELYNLFSLIPQDDMECLKYYYENNPVSKVEPDIDSSVEQSDNPILSTDGGDESYIEQSNNEDINDTMPSENPVLEYPQRRILVR